MKKIKKILSSTPFMVCVVAIVCMVIFRSIFYAFIDKEEIVNIPVEEVVVVKQEKEPEIKEMLIIGKTFTDTFEKEKEAEQGVRDGEAETITINLQESAQTVRQEAQAADKPAEKEAEELIEAESAAAEIKEADLEESIAVVHGDESEEYQESNWTEEKEPEEALKACDHSWVFESYYQNPTCRSGGLENQICSKCGLRQTTPGTPTGEHVFETETEGNCVSEEIVICKDCNYRKIREKNPDKHIDVEEGFCYGCGSKIQD